MRFIGAVEDRSSAIGGVMGPKYKGSPRVMNRRLRFNRGPDAEINTDVTHPEVFPSIVSTVLPVFSYVIVFFACVGFLGRKAYDNWSVTSPMIQEGVSERWRVQLGHRTFV